MKLLNGLQVLVIKITLICFMVIIAIPAKGISYLTDSLKKSSRCAKGFLILTIILTGELPHLAQRLRTSQPEIMLVHKDSHHIA